MFRLLPSCFVQQRPSLKLGKTCMIGSVLAYRSKHTKHIPHIHEIKHVRTRFDAELVATDFDQSSILGLHYEPESNKLELSSKNGTAFLYLDTIGTFPPKLVDILKTNEIIRVHHMNYEAERKYKDFIQRKIQGLKSKTSVAHITQFFPRFGLTSEQRKYIVEELNENIPQESQSSALNNYLMYSVLSKRWEIFRKEISHEDELKCEWCPMIPREIDAPRIKSDIGILKSWMMNKYDKNNIYIRKPNEFPGGLPVLEFTGRTLLYEKKSQLLPYIRELRDSIYRTPIPERFGEYLDHKYAVGFDTESTPVFVKGQTTHVALIQLSTPELAVLFRMNENGRIPDPLLEILKDESILKVAQGVKFDVRSIMQQYPEQWNDKELNEVVKNGYFDLAWLSNIYGIKNNGLQSIAAMFLGHKLLKTEQVSNWSNDTLTKKQISYAAVDAWASLILLYESLDCKLNDFLEYFSDQHELIINGNKIISPPLIQLTSNMIDRSKTEDSIPIFLEQTFNTKSATDLIFKITKGAIEYHNKSKNPNQYRYKFRCQKIPLHYIKPEYLNDEDVIKKHKRSVKVKKFPDGDFVTVVYQGNPSKNMRAAKEFARRGLLTVIKDEYICNLDPYEADEDAY